jgi:hypothetical protein
MEGAKKGLGKFIIFKLTDYEKNLEKSYNYAIERASRNIREHKNGENKG